MIYRAGMHYINLEQVSHILYDNDHKHYAVYMIGDGQTNFLLSVSEFKDFCWEIEQKMPAFVTPRFPV